ncbi:MAG TPA: hypothetical protein VHG89_06015 [Verrucomicrobiae bacterium]|nr:hypothetical protein [Verrucomicrobiae bacterium]
MKKAFNKELQIHFTKRKFLHELDRRERRRARKKAGFRKSYLVNSHPTFIHPLLHLLRKKFVGKNCATFDKENNRWIIKIPSVFSFIKNPEETLNTIYSLVEISKSPHPPSIFFDYSQLTDLDIGASAALDVVAFSLKEEWKACKLDYRFAGELPTIERFRQIVMAMGITKQLNVKGVNPSPDAEKYIVKFPLYRGYKQFRSEIGGPQHRDRAVTSLVDYLNDCLFVASE